MIHKYAAVLCILLMLFSACEQIEDEPFTAVLTPGTSGEWDDLSVSDPCVVFDSPTYYMFYTGCQDDVIYHIGRATSPDGITWTKDVSPIINADTNLWNEKGVTNPCAVYISSTDIHLWFSGIDSSNTWSIGYAHYDGTWNVNSTPELTDAVAADAFDAAHVLDPCVYFDGVTYHIWYTGVNNGGELAIGYTSTTTPGTGLSNAASPVLELSAGSYFAGGLRAPAIVYDASEPDYKYQMWPTAWNGGTYGHTITKARSMAPDTGWQANSVPVLQPHTVGFDNVEVKEATVLKGGAEFKMWYSGVSSSKRPSIGYAVSSEGIVWKKYKE